MQKYILVIFDRSWSEVDWILPVLKSLKIIQPNIRIITLFSPEWNAYNSVPNNKTLEVELNQIADEIIKAPPQGTKQSIFISGIDHQEQVCAILRLSGKTAFKKSIQTVFKTAKVVFFPDGPYFGISQNFNHPRYFNRWEKNSEHHDCYIIDSLTIAPDLCRVFSNLKVSEVGFPRYDQWWIDHLLKQPEFLNSIEARKAKSYAKVFLFITKGPQREFPKDVFYYVTRSVFEVLLSDANNFVIVKTHPRHNLTWITSCLKGYNPEQWMISTLHPIQQSALSDFVISVSSTCILDALAVQKPVIEFSPNFQPTEAFNIDSQGGLMSVFSLMGMCAYARTKEEMIFYLNHYFDQSSDKTMWERHQLVFQSLSSPEDNASKRAAELIIHLSTSQNFNDLQSYNIFTADQLLSPTKRLFLNKDNNSLSLEIKRIKALGMPIGSIFFRELQTIFNFEICIITGTACEHLSNETAKLFKQVYVIESASDLYQMKSMKEISNVHNVHICHSAYILKKILEENFNKKIFFWLDTHENAHVTFKSKTQTPIVEELKVIRESNIKDAVILINHLKYFQPVLNDGFEAQTDRKYPDFNQVVSEINKGYHLAVIGDMALVYPQHSQIHLSSGVQACTIDRLYNGKNFDVNTIIQADNIIAYHLNDIEKRSIMILADDYISIEDQTVGGHYFYWRGLIYFGDKRYNEATKLFKMAFQKGYCYFNLMWFLAQSAYKENNKDLARKMLLEIITAQKDFEPAQMLLSTIE